MKKLWPLILLGLFCWALCGVSYHTGYDQGQIVALAWARCVADPACHATNDPGKSP